MFEKHNVAEAELAIISVIRYKFRDTVEVRPCKLLGINMSFLFIFQLIILLLSLSTLTLLISTPFLNDSRIPRSYPVPGMWLPVFSYARGIWTLISNCLCF